MGMTSSLRPRDAATLVLVRRDGMAPRLLMGCRAGGHAFMPNKWVFPGGRLDRADWHVPAAGDLAPEVVAQVAAAPRRRLQAPDRFARALALAAVRETFEETGLVLGQTAPARGRRRKGPHGWDRFLDLGYQPDLSSLGYLARAITPPGRTRRFDARFFLADAAQLATLDPVDSHELMDLRWFTLAEALTLDLPTVTRAVLGLVEGHLAGAAPPPPFWAWRRASAD
jgi:8-oxo-dGTP pyrophosphatase MutT (NUDIX family)